MRYTLKNCFLESVPFLVLFTYLVLSFIYSFERILNTDNSYFFFQIINSHTFLFPENRIGIVVSQLPLLLFLGWGTSLTTLVYVYSLTFPLEYIIIALVCHFYLKVKESSLLIASSLILGVSFSFLHPVTETYHALIYSTLTYSLGVSNRLKHRKVIYFLTIIVASLFTLYSHPVGAFLLGFMALFACYTKQVKFSQAAFIFGLAGFSLILRLILVKEGSYDVKQYDNFYASIKSIRDIEKLYPVTYLKSRLDSVYLSSIILLVAGIIIATISKQKMLFFLSLCCCFGFTMIGILTFSLGDADMMMEKAFMPSVFMISEPFCYIYTFKITTGKPVFAFIFLLISGLSFKQIIVASKVAEVRLNLLQEIALESNTPKLIAQFSDFNNPSLRFNHWNTSIDSYIIAKCKLNKPFSLFLTDDKYSYSFDSTDSRLFLGPTWYPNWNYDMLNLNYFYLPEEPYKIR